LVSRYEFIRTEKAFPVTALCRVLQVSRAAYYDWLHRKPSARQKKREDLQLKVKAVHDRSRGTYGSPRVHEQLRRAGEVVSEKTVAKIMQEEGIAARRPRKFKATTDSRHTKRIAPNLLERDFTADAPNQVWVHPRYLRRGRRPSSSGFGEAFASTGAERTWVLEHRSAAETKPKPEIGGRPGPLRFRRWLRPTSDRGLRVQRRQLGAQGRNLGAESGSFGAQDRTRSAQNRRQSAQSRRQSAQNRTRSAQNRTRSAQNRRQSAQNRTRSAQNRTRSAQNRTRSAQNRRQSAQNRTRSAQNRRQSAQNRR